MSPAWPSTPSSPTACMSCPTSARAPRSDGGSSASTRRSTSRWQPAGTTEAPGNATLPTVPLPNNPSVEQLRTQAKAVRDLAGAGVQGALDLVGAHHPDGPHAVTLTGAQLVVARHYGFSSWARLTRHVEMIERYRRDPDEVEDASDPVDAFLALACLRYGDDDPSRWSRAAAILDAHPAARAHPLVAAAACDVEALGAALATDATAAVREGGPYRWPPILYLTYARHDPRITDERALAAARLLLDHGADANSGYL